MTGYRASRFVKALLAAATALLAGVVISACDGTPFVRTCDEGFSVKEWNSEEPEDHAEFLVECGTLDGMSREEVLDLLGRDRLESKPGVRRVWFAAGWVNDFIGPGDGQSLIVIFDENDRVARTEMAL